MKIKQPVFVCFAIDPIFLFKINMILTTRTQTNRGLTLMSTLHAIDIEK